MRQTNLQRKCFENNWANFLITLAALCLNAVLAAAVAVFMQEILDIAASGSLSDIKGMLLKICCYVLLLISGWLAELIFRSRFLQKAMGQLKTEVFRRIMKKGISAFSQEPTGRYLSLLTNDMTSIETNYLQNSFQIALNCIYFAAALGFMLWYDILLTIISVTMVGSSLLISVLLSGLLAKEEKKVSLQNEGFVGLAKDLLNGFPVIKSFKAEREILNVFCRKNHVLECVKTHRRKTEGFINMVGNGLGFVVQAGVIIVGTCFAIQGRISVGVLIAFVQLMNYIIIPVGQLPSAFANRNAALGLFAKIENVLDSHFKDACGKTIPNINTCIRLENVSFGYEPDQTILRDVSLTFEKGKSYAIIGSSGSGKSTLLNLLLGSSHSYTGSIRFDEEELREISADSLYDLMSVVFQNTFVFNDTIEKNITMYKSFEHMQIDTAIHASGLKKLVDEKGLSYSCGENGCNLSGGEKQRISIARGLLRDCGILLMDEATSALDQSTSAAIEEKILQMKDTLRIIITHKLNPQMLKQYDGIVVMKDGRVEQTGTYHELLQECDYFKQLLRS